MARVSFLLFHASFEQDKLFLRFLSYTETYLCVGDQRFRQNTKGAAHLVLMETEVDRIIQTADGTLRKISAFRALGGLFLSLLTLLAALSVPLFACVWGFRYLIGGMKGVRHLRVRVFPLLAVLSAVTFIGILFAGGNDLITRLGRPTVWSIALCLSTWAFALFSGLGLLAVVRVPRSEVHPLVYLHSLLASVLFSVATVYLACFGMIGLRTWV